MKTIALLGPLDHFIKCTNTEFFKKCNCHEDYRWNIGAHYNIPVFEVYIISSGSVECDEEATKKHYCQRPPFV